MPSLFAHALTCRRGERFVFANLDFQIDAGQAMVLSGCNGSGKSSLLRILAGLLSPYGGDLRWQGEAPHPLRMTYVGHQDAVKPVLTVRENLRLFADLCKEECPADTRITQALAAFDLNPLAEVAGRYLSSGQKRRTALARIMLQNSPLWLLDEPTVGLDAASVARLEQLIEDHRKAGGMVIYATHIPLNLADLSVLNMDRFAIGWEEMDGIYDEGDVLDDPPDAKERAA